MKNPKCEVLTAVVMNTAVLSDMTCSPWKFNRRFGKKISPPFSGYENNPIIKP
jgi:hypothetical protein